MNWKTELLKFLRNLVICIVVCVVILCTLGYIFGGREGLLNMAYWGLVFGLVGGFSWGIGMILLARFYGSDENYRFLPEWNWFIKKSGDEDKNSDH